MNTLGEIRAKIRVNSCLLLLCALLPLAGCSQDKHIPPAQFAREMKDSNAIVLDVRTPEEFSAGHLKGALNIDWNGDHFNDEVKQLDPSKTILVYCRTSRRSAAAAESMRASGFKVVHVMEGGILQWRAEGLPEEK